MAEFLSDEWIAELDRATKDVRAAQRLVIQQVVVGDDQQGIGDVAWHVDVTPQGTTVLPGRAEDPDVTFTQDRVTAEAIARGERAASTALVEGTLTVRGRVARLAEAREALAALDEAIRA